MCIYFKTGGSIDISLVHWSPSLDFFFSYPCSFTMQYLDNAMSYSLSLSLSLSLVVHLQSAMSSSLHWHGTCMPIFATADDLECREYHSTTLVSCICVLAVCTQKLLPTKIICCFLVAEIEGLSSCSFFKKKHTLKLALPTDPFKMTVN